MQACDGIRGRRGWGTLQSLVTLVFMALALAGLLAAGYLPRRETERALARAALEEKERIPLVRVTRAKRAPATLKLVLPGSTEPITETLVFARADGYLVRRHVDIGDRVTQGQALAEIESPELDKQVLQAGASLLRAKAALAQSQASVVRARARLKLAKVTVERWDHLLKQGFLALQDRDEKRADYDVKVSDLEVEIATARAAESNVNASQAEHERLKALQAFETIRAPFAGVITARSVDTGALITSGRASGRELFRIAQISTLRVSLDVPQSAVPFVKVGLPASVTVQELPGRTFKGRVRRTANALAESSRTLLGEVEVDNADLVLMPGMYATVTVEISRPSPPLSVPGDALLIRSEGTRVAVVRDSNTVRLVPVEVGRDSGTAVEIHSGLRDGDRVVVSPSDDVVDGARVEPVEGTAAGLSAPARSPAAGPRP